MKTTGILMLVFCFFSAFGQKQCIYPTTEKSNVTDTFWHKTVQDPYRWLENINSDKTKKWLEGQVEIRDKYSSKLAENLTEHLSNYARIKSKRIAKQGKYYFTYRANLGVESYSLYYQFSIDEEPRLLFNPNILDKTGTVSIDGITISADEKTLAIVLAKNGSDWKTIRFLDMEKRELLSDSLRFVKFSPLYWSGNGMFYIMYDVKDESESFNGLIKIKALQYHIVGTKQDEDIPVFTPENINDEFHFEVTQGERYLILSQEKKRNGVYAQSVALKELPYKKDEAFRNFITSSKTGFYFDVVGEMNDKLLVASNMNAKNGTIYKYDPLKLNSFEKFIPQYKERMLRATIVRENKIVVLYNGDKRSYAVINDSAGNKLKSWSIPEGFSFSGMTYSRGDSVLLYYFDSFFNPSSVYKLNLNTLEQSPVAKVIVPFSFSDLTTERVYFYSKDSTLIPMYLTHKKNIKLDGKNPTLLYGYGGFGKSMGPSFKAEYIPFLNSGGLLAIPQLRGGGDFPGWHQQGIRLKKQNTFDDFIAAAEYLIREKYTSPEKLAAMGGSNGGLLVGACMTQRPELFKVVISTAGVLDMMRYHLYNVGYRYKYEYGDVTDSLDFENLLRYSPVQNVKKDVDYPATLLVASDNDDRVNPFHSFKFLSELQEKGSGKNPYILYYAPNAGHTGSRVFDERMKTSAFIYSFIYKYLGMESKIYFED